MSETKMIKIGRVELTPEEAYRMYKHNMYIVTSSKIFQLFYDGVRQKVFGIPIYYSPGMSHRGRFYTMGAESVNNFLGFELIQTDGFPVVTKEKQDRYEVFVKRRATGIPMICGTCGRACRQLEKAEGANRASCMYCPLARYAAININTKDS